LPLALEVESSLLGVRDSLTRRLVPDILALQTLGAGNLDITLYTQSFQPVAHDLVAETCKFHGHGSGILAVTQRLQDLLPSIRWRELSAPGGELMASLQTGRKLIEERAYAAGDNLYDGTTRRMIRALYELGPQDLGQEQWFSLVSAFTSLVREEQPKGEKETVEGFFEKIEHARQTATNQKLKLLLNVLADTRKQAEEFQADVANGDIMKSLDPLQASLMELAHTWNQKLKRPIRIMHDAQNALTDKVMKAVLMTATEKMPKEYNLPDSRFDLREIKHVDSKSDPAFNWQTSRQVSPDK